MKTVIIVSRCTKVERFNATEGKYHFHFKGMFGGEALKKVLLRARLDFGITKDQEYLMYVQMHSCDGGILTGVVLKLRPLEECWDRS